MRPTIKIHDITTGEVIEREMTSEEFANYQATIAGNAAQDQALAEKEAAKAAIATRLGLTADELATLLS
jgi:hypothetical protein